MSSYKTVVVGTDGSDSSLRAVDRAGALASGPDAKIGHRYRVLPLVATIRAPPTCSRTRATSCPGNAPIYAILREAKDRAKAAGADNIEEKAIVGAPVDALVDLAEEVKADLLVVGNVGLEHHRRPVARFRARQRLAAIEDRRTDRAHHLTPPAPTARAVPHRICASGATATRRPAWWCRHSRRRSLHDWASARVRAEVPRHSPRYWLRLSRV